MRHIIIFTLSLFIVCSIGCKKDEVSNNPSTPVTLNNSFAKALLDKTQYFTFTANNGIVCQSSSNGVDICLNTNCLELNGEPVTGEGEILLEYIEIFDRGSMIVTNKPTMGLDDGEYNMLKSGGEFYMQAYQDGVELSLSGCSWWDLSGLIVPGSLTGGMDNDMTAWSGSLDDNNDILWTPMLVTQINAATGGATMGPFGPVTGINGVVLDPITGQWTDGFQDASAYSLPFTFGWSNCDVFSSWPEPKTTVEVDVPDDYDGGNSQVFITYGQDDNTGAFLNYDYGSYPDVFSTYENTISVGLEAHFIFLLQYGDGSFRYAIETVTVQDNQVVEFLESDLIEATANELEAAINALP